jgi:choline dehydrogenase
MDRPNLRVITGAQATRVLFDGTKATGVEYQQDGARHTISARREIVLSGGAINTPQLLLLSGIGPAADLQSFGIPVIRDLRGVGQTLQDHLGVYVQHQSLQPVTLYSLFRPDRAALGLAQVALFGTGPFAALPLEAGAFVKTRPELETPDIQVSMVPGLNLETTRKGQGKHGFLIHIYQLRPESRGTVTLASPDPLAKPKMFANYLATELDRVTTRDGVKFARKLFAQDSFKPYLGAPISPSADVQSDAEIDGWVRDNGQTVFHPASGARMGADNDPLAVLDAELRVRGVQNLRVADASAMPAITSGNTQAPTVMIAEKAAEMMLRG